MRSRFPSIIALIFTVSFGYVVGPCLGSIQMVSQASWDEIESSVPESTDEPEPRQNALVQNPVGSLGQLPTNGTFANGSGANCVLNSFDLFFTSPNSVGQVIASGNASRPSPPIYELLKVPIAE